eukprot:TRINITY_DN920_c0_g1_i2.p1 TRINITY_DN920_c0_g1~~TRINITY_DN920_c0_g1_i2.p1  ORF type:complete len:4610 (-),score=1017.36 TRINITY_DN920_c0_g1_i2:106-13935(-)
MLSARLQWIAENVASAFGRQEYIKQIEVTIQEGLNLKKLNEFLEGKTKQQHIFFFYQRPDTHNDLNEVVDAGKEPKLTITTGENDRIKSFAVYFLRNVPPEKSIRADVASDHELLFGEVTPNPLDSLSTTLASVFRPMASHTQNGTNWGQCEEEQKTDFLGNFEKFTMELSEAIKALNGGIVLKKTLPGNGVLDPQSPTYQDTLKEEPTLVGEYGQLLEDWCRDIERYLEEGLDQHKVEQEPGPRTELEYWRGRMQKITSITEQLKCRECKAVFNVVHAVTQKGSADVAPQHRQTVFNTVRRWKQIDISITEAFNEAKDNVKYLTTLEKFIEPLYSGTPVQIIDTLPALMNSVKMIHTIARYYNTSERMTNLFAKITNQMITNCKACILGEEDDASGLWDKHPPELIKNLEVCLKLNAAFQEQYRITKDKLLTLPKGKQFDFSETLIFGRFDLFCRRVVKLIDMFSTIHQFRQLKIHLKSMNGIHQLVGQFQSIVDDFKVKRHHLLEFLNNRFDRDYVEFNVRISELETALQDFINHSFQNIASIDTSLKLLSKFQSILQHGNLRTDLESKFGVIFHNYGQELTILQDLYEKHKSTPHTVRNMPPAAGNIMWARHLLHRIMDPMQKFHQNPMVMSGGKETKRITRMYNKMAKCLVEFEIVWHQAWVNSIETTKQGLTATLIVKHPEDQKHHVNFDMEILQLIRETRCLDRMGNIEIPESARMLLLQEQKFKAYYSELQHLLREYRRVTQLVRPITAQLLKPHLDHLEFQLRPGMVTLTWTSMNIDSYMKSVWDCIDRLEQLITNVNDIMESRIDANLRLVSRVLLADLPEDNRLVSLEDFVDLQEKHVRQTTSWLMAKNQEIESAVNDMLGAIVVFPLDSHVRGISESEIIKVKAHYNWSMYQALLATTKMSLHKVKERLSARRLPDGSEPPAFFEIDLQLNGLGVCLQPSIEEIQAAISGGAVAVLKCSKMIEAWDTVTIPRNVQLLLNPNLPPVRGTGSQGTFYDRVAQDNQILKVVLLLTGSIQSARNGRDQYLKQFEPWSWLWSKDIGDEYRRFRESQPSLDEYEAKLRSLTRLDDDFSLIEPRRQISALSLHAGSLTRSLRELAGRWKEHFARELHSQAFQRLEKLSELIKSTMKKLVREVADGDIDALGHVMRTLRDVREKQGEIELELEPIAQMYSILDTYLPNILDKEEQDARSMLQSSWARLLAESETRQEELTVKQVQFKRNLIKTVHSFKRDVEKFRRDYEERGPMVKGIRPKEAVERLKRFREEYEVHGRKQEIFALGEDLFGLPHQRYVQLSQTEQELAYLSQLYELYTAVLDTIGTWKDYLWVDVPGKMEDMKKEADQFALRCKKMPKQLRQWPAYHELKKEIEDFQEVLPLLMELSKKSIQGRHWQQVNDITGKDLQVEREDFRLQSLIDAKLNGFKDEITDITESADKQLIIEEKMGDITAQWSTMTFEFAVWKTRPEPCILVGYKVNEVQEALEETQMLLNAMNAQRHSQPFKEELVALITTLSDTADTIERWFKVQQMWTSLESVFTGGDIAKQMPMEAKKFSQIDKDWLKIMYKSAETQRVVECCQNDLLRQMMPMLLAGLETCQKSLESYLEGKRQKFPRFYFTSDPVLLKILSQGSDPETIQDDFEKLFDAISRVTFDKIDRRKILEIQSVAGTAREIVKLQSPVIAQGNIEDWLHTVELEMQRSVRRECRNCALECNSVMNGLSIRSFADKYIAQVALLGIQLIWTADFQNALIILAKEKDKTVMPTTNRKFVQLLAELIAVCLQNDLTKLDRVKYETLVTIHVHQKDLFQEVMKKPKDMKVKDENDFEWLKQTRLYWRTEHDHAVISIADVDFTYSYEYLGCKERLVITALTDRCYLTQSQALGMFFGGAPAGPAGTGKTETTKDMGRTLGIFVVVTNCSDQHRFKDMAKIFKGLCMSGLWGCFDEFNRLVPEVLSVCTVQFKAVCDAIRAHQTRFLLQGDEISLDPEVGCYITMNPGYLGRSELPEGLKALFRPITVMVPDFKLIMENMFMGEGFTESKALGLKFATLYALNKDLLSPSKKYDWGMRAIKSVLVVAGSFKRADPSLAEQAVLMRSLRDTNVAKIEGDDLKVFMGLLSDLFPGIDVPRARDYDMEELLVDVMQTDYGWSADDDGYLVLKISQLIELLGIRHCVFLMGNPGSFKTFMWKCLKNAKTRRGEKTTVVDFSPKAISTTELYGFVNMATREWKDGIISKVMRDLGQIPDTHPKWIMLDGDLDANWIESMNSVMDDNRLLTLPSNERIPLKGHMKMIFEIRDLNYATPATATRAGIVCMDDTFGVQWKMYVKSWIKKREDPDAIKEQLQACFTKYGDAATRWMLKNSKILVPMVDICLIMACCSMLDNLLKPECYEALEYWFVFCFTSGVGMCLAEVDGVDYRKKFSDWWKNECKNLKYPLRGGVFDYYVKDGKLEDWSTAVETLEYSSETPMGEVTVPTGETTCMTYIMRALIEEHHAIMLIGLAGCGKTQSCLGLLRKLPVDTFSFYGVNMSFYTDSSLLRTMLENPLEKKAGKLFAPPGKLQLIYFVDDLNMPALDKYNTQSAIELMKQHSDYKHWYDLTKIQVKDIGNTQFMCCMNPTAGSFIVNQRLQRHFWTCAVPFPEQSSLSIIYSTFMKGHFERLSFKNQVQEQISGIIKAALTLQGSVVSSFRKTASNFHYEFNIRHMSGVFNGLLQAKPAEFVEAEKIVLLWIHESWRIYGDRLVSPADLKKYCALSADLAKKMFGKFNFGKYFQDKNPEPLVFAPFSKGIAEMDGGGFYDKIPSAERLGQLLGDALREYNENSAAMDLVLFNDAMCHVGKICRIITSTPGHPLLVGVGGSGRQSLSRLSAYTCLYTTIMIVISGSYGMNDLKADLQAMYTKAGIKDEGVMFLFTDGQITNEKFLVYINDLLASGDIADLYASDEKDAVRNGVRSGCKGAGIQDTPENLWMFFISRIRKNLHMSLCFSPVGDAMRGRARKFPALINCTVIDWFQPWPYDALYDVGRKFLEPIEQLGAQDSPVRQGIMDFMPFSFDAAGKVAINVMKRERRFAYTTPKSFLELIKLYTTMVGKKVDALEDQKDRLTNGLEKLKATQISVAALEEELKVKAVVVAEKAAAADIFAAEVGEKKANVEAESAKAAIEAQSCAVIAKDVSAQQASCEKDLAAAIPLVQQAEAALDVLDKKDFQELKVLAKPPGGVDLVCEAAMHLQCGYSDAVELDKKGGLKDGSWKAAQKMMGNPEKFLQDLKGFKSFIDDGKCGANNVEKARKIQISMGSDFTQEGMAKKSGAAAGLCVWIINIIMYYDVVVQVEPKRNALREATETLNAANTKLAEVKALVADLEANLAKLMKEFDKAMAEKNALMADAEKCQNKLDMAQRLVGALSANGVIWEQTVQNAGEELVIIPGDTLVACSFASYVGVFTRQYRETCVDGFKEYLAKKGVPLGPKPDPLAVLSSDAEIAAWAGQGLPSDRVSCENGSILCNSQRWGLIIDPQLQGIVWIKNKESEGGLAITRMGHAKMLNTFEVSIDQGKPVLIENMGESIEAVIMPVVSRNTIKRGNKRVFKLGDKEITLNNAFKLFMQTKLSNPHYPPEIQAECTIINFTVTQDGLEDQILFLVVKLERPDLARKKTELITQQNEFKVTLAQLEALLLEKLANAEGDILDDTELILSLEEAKKTADEVKEKQVIAQETELKINETSEFYRPSGARGALLFFMMMDLSKMHTFYKYSLDSFVVVVTRAVNSVTLRKPKEVPKEEPKEEVEDEKEGDEDADEDEEEEEAPAEEEEEEEEIIELTGKELKLRIDLLCNVITLFTWNYTRRGLLDADKLTVISMVSFKILVRAGKIGEDEQAILINAPPDPAPPPMPENAKSWLTETQWAQLKTLENMEAFKKGGQLTQNIEQDSLGWKRWYSEEKAENADLPRSSRDLSPFHRLFLLRVMRQDRIGAALTQFVIDNLGTEYTEQPPFDMTVAFEESSALSPFFFVLFPGVDPTPTIEALGRGLGITEANGRFVNISMGQGQEKVALNGLTKAAKEGGWIMLQNIHLMQDWLKELERALEVVEEFSHEDFRCFLSSEPPGALQGPLWDLIPEPILQRCIKVADEAPTDLKSNLRRAYSKFSQDNIDECTKPKEFKAMLFALCFFHSLMSGRIKFGAQGWTKKYPFNDGDLTICGAVLKNYLNGAEALGNDVPWPDIRYLFGEIMYGGHITDPWDRRVNNTYLAVLITPELLVGGNLAPGFKSPDSSKLEYAQYVKYIEERFPPEIPQMFGLHPNAEIGFLTNQGINIFKTISEISGGGGGGAGSDVNASQPIITTYLSQLPTNLDMLDIRAKVKDEDVTPFIIVSFQEGDRENALLSQMRSSMLELELGISGALNVTENMELLATNLQANKVNPSWEGLACPSLKGLAAWFADILLRYEQINEWANAAKLLKSIWISGIFKPQSFLTSNMQVAARTNSLPLDYMTNRSRFYNIRDLAEVSGLPEVGVNVHGLFLEGAGWEDGKGDDEGYITESKMKDLHPAMPVCNIFAVHIDVMDWTAMYHCPVFITSLRRGPEKGTPDFAYLANMRMDPDDFEHRWTLAGAAMLFTDD